MDRVRVRVGVSVRVWAGVSGGYYNGETVEERPGLGGWLGLQSELGLALALGVELEVGNGIGKLWQRHQA